MSHDNNDVSRRTFARAAVAAVAVPVLAPLAACAPPQAAPAPAPSATPADSAAAAPPADAQEPTPLARALGDAVRVQYGERMTEAEMAKVQRSISGTLQTAERLRRFDLPIWTDPAFVYRVPGGAP